MAVDRGGGGAQEHDSPSGTLSLGDEDARELAPACVQDRPIQPSLGGDAASRRLNRAGGRGRHGSNTKILQREHVAGVDQAVGGLVMEVAPLVADLAPLFGEGPPPPSVAGAGPGPRGAALQINDPLLRGIQEPRVGHDLPVAGSQEPRHSQINPD
jgi:hypothetical protein